MKGSSEGEVASEILIQAKDDIMGRVSSYWLPRYLLHCHNSREQLVVLKPFVCSVVHISCIFVHHVKGPDLEKQKY